TRFSRDWSSDVCSSDLVDFLNIVEHIEHISSLILEICGGQAGPVSDQSIALPARPAVTMRLERCRKVLGIPVTETHVRDVFTKQIGRASCRESGMVQVV